MKILYLIQTHKNPEQIYKLVETIKKLSPSSYILISHDIKGCPLDTTPIQHLSNVEVIRGLGGRGDFSIIQGYLDSLDWIFHRNIQFDWLFNLSGQDYPTQPLSKVEKFLSETKYDGFLRYYNILSDSQKNPWGSREGRDRYLYQYWHSGRYLSYWQRALFKLPQEVINHVQNMIKINSTYNLMLGRCSTSHPFNDKFICYAGSYFHTISRRCVEYLYEFCQQNNSLINYYKRTCIPDESFIQTVLVNSNLFSFYNKHKRYCDWKGSCNGSPRILTVNDYPKLIQGDFFFARKFDIKQDSRIIDMLDAKILKF